MNCKKGDLAVIVRQAPLDPRSLGAIVEVVETGPTIKFHVLGGGVFPSWFVRSKEPFVMHNGRKSTYFFVPDALLRPIRDNDGQDEMLRIAGLPKTLETV